MVSITAQRRRRLLLQLEGSPVVEAANNRFDATMTNVVTWSAPASENGHDESSKQLESNAEIQVGFWPYILPLCRNH